MDTVAAFAEEVAELASLLSSLSCNSWTYRTAFRGWTIFDVILHLYASDYSALVSASDPAAFQALRADMLRQREKGLTMLEESRQRFADMTIANLLANWESQAADLCRLLDARDPADRIAWSGPGMSIATFATARQMETWAHGQEIYDVLGLEREPCDRIRHIALLGVKTFGWSFSNRALPLPPIKPSVKLRLPSGQTVTTTSCDEDNRIEGTAYEFCQVVTQVRNIDDTSLDVTGAIAQEWMRIAQCFAGPPVDPPAAGTRKKQIAPQVVHRY